MAGCAAVEMADGMGRNSCGNGEAILLLVLWNRFRSDKRPAVVVLWSWSAGVLGGISKENVTLSTSEGSVEVLGIVVR